MQLIFRYAQFDPGIRNCRQPSAIPRFTVGTFIERVNASTTSLCRFRYNDGHRSAVTRPGIRLTQRDWRIGNPRVQAIDFGWLKAVR